MKRNFYLTCILIIGFSAAQAQKPITLVEDSLQFGSRYFPGFMLTIPEVKPSDVKSNWIKAIQKGTKSKVKTDNNEMTIFGANIADFKNGSVNISSKITDQDSLTFLFVSVETTRDNFIGNQSEEYEKLSNYLKKFAKSQYVETAKKQLSAEEDKLKKMEKELKSARKSRDRFDKNIQSANVKITQQNDKIKGVNKELATLEIRINNNDTAVSVLEEGDAKDKKKSELKDLQKTKKSLLKTINSAKNTISKAETSIQDNRNSIEQNENSQNEIKDQIAQQKNSIAKFQQKLNTIQAY